MHLTCDDLFDRALLDQMLTGRYVKTTPHPELPLQIYNYTSRTQYDGVWNDVTRTCRGLIVDTDQRIIARPFTKFFALDQHDGTHPAGPVHVTEKLDGSLGIVYPTPDGYAIATRGSFTSDQARHATRVWRDRYQTDATLNTAWTYLCEIIYPANRIVVDYHGLDDLVLIGAVDIATGRSVPLDQARAGWPGPVVDEHHFATAADAFAAGERTNAEGFVVHFTDPDIRIKVKHGDYVHLPRILTDVSERRIWEALSENVDLGPWLDGVPDEFYTYVHTTRDQMLAAYRTLEHELRSHHQRIIGVLGPGHTRRAFAEAVTELAGTYPHAKTLFALADGKDHTRALWAALRPAAHLPRFGRHDDSG